MEKIVIVESPSKSKTISTYLGDGYTVLSSKGHIRDLKTSGKGGLGINIEHGFEPDYEIMKDKVSLVKSLQKACKNKEVFLATDPDREGEAIAFHLAKVLGLDFNAANRIEFHEVTKKAVKEALEHPHKIDMQMVDSQECRRMIDRILGFKLSKLLQKKLGSKSAGRVQSVVLLMIVNLEKEIKSFIPTSYYEMEADFNFFKLKLSEINGKVIDSKNRITDRVILENLKSRLLSFVVSNIASKQSQRNPYPPFTTSTMQQDASNKLGFTATRTMRIAQGLYEGKNIGEETVGLITYMRTDSTRLSDGFVNDTNNYILKNYGNKYLTYKPKTHEQKNMQDAHEAIRPTDINRNPEEIKRYLTDEEYKLYSLIYKRAIASFMPAAIYNVTTVEFSNTDSVWKTSGSQLVFDGYQKVYGHQEEEEPTLPTFELGKAYNATEIKILDKETQPKSRYSEASLIKDMEEKGIGRPSTYAQTIQTLKEREYIQVDKKALVPSEQGILTSDKLQEFFSSLINVEYTANMETNLDKIAQGEQDKVKELSDFYANFMPLLEKANELMQALYPIATDEICPVCGKNLVIRLGKYGEFTSCSNYPDCTYTRNDDSKPETLDTGITCPICGKGTIVRRVAGSGKNKGKFFYGCSNYPKCKAIFNDEPTNEVCPNCGAMMLKDSSGNLYCSKKCNEIKENEPIVLCPVCGKGHLIKRTAARGKNKGNVFYGCSLFPKCKTIISVEEYAKLPKA